MASNWGPNRCLTNPGGAANEIDRLRAALETAQRRRAETAAGAKREFDRMRNERDDARSVADSLAENLQAAWDRHDPGVRVPRMPWDSKGADDGE